MKQLLSSEIFILTFSNACVVPEDEIAIAASIAGFHTGNCLADTFFRYFLS